MKKIISEGFLLLSILFFTACNDNDNNSTPITYGDAFILSEISLSDDAKENVVYSLIINAYSTNYTINSVNVTGNYNNYTLTNSNGLYSYKDGPYDDYNIFSDIYNFNYTFDSTTATSSNNNTVTSYVIQPAEITSCIGSPSSIDVKWNTIENANALLIQMKNSEGVVVFSNNNYSNQLNATEYTISNDTGLWEEGYYLNEGETYTVEILGFLTEENLPSYIQAKSLASANVVWE